jgi:tetratricopeptide (TPR) repeat protein
MDDQQSSRTDLKAQRPALGQTGGYVRSVQGAKTASGEFSTVVNHPEFVPPRRGPGLGVLFSVMLTILLFAVIAGYMKSMVDKGAAKQAVELGHSFYKKGHYPLAIREFDKAINGGVNTADVYAWKAMAELKGGAFDKALADFNQALNLDPNNTALLIGRAQAELRVGDFEKAIADSAQALVNNSKSLEALRVRSSAYAQAADYNSAINDVNIAETMSPDLSADFYATRGYAKYKLGKTDAALVDYEKATRKAPHAVPFLMDKASLLKDSKQYDKAIESLTSAIRVAGKKPAFLAMRAKCKMLKGDKDGAAADLNTAVEFSETTGTIRECIDISMLLGRKDLAYDYVSKLVELDPADTSAAKQRETLASELGKTRTIVRSRTAEPSETPTIAVSSLKGLSLQDLINKGYSLLQSGSPRDAMVVLTEALRKDSRSVDARRLIIFSLLAQGNADGAAKQLSVLETITKLEHSELYKIAQQFDQQSAYSQAATIYERLIAMHPDDFDSRISLIKACMRMGNNARAAQISKSGLLQKNISRQQKLTLEEFVKVVETVNDKNDVIRRNEDG